MKKKLFQRRMYAIAAAGLLGCIVMATGWAQVQPPVESENVVSFNLTAESDLSLREAVAEIPDDIPAGTVVDLAIKVDVPRDRGAFIGVRESYPVEVWEVHPGYLGRGFHDTEFDFSTLREPVFENGTFYVSFTMPENVAELDLHFAAEYEWRSVIRANDDGSSATVSYRIPSYGPYATIVVKAFAPR